MSETKTPSLFGDAFAAELATIVKQAVRDELKHRPTIEDRLLDADEAAKLLSVSPDWLYHNRKNLPFSRKLGPKMLRFSYAAILRWMESKKFS